MARAYASAVIVAPVEVVREPAFPVANYRTDMEPIPLTATC